MDSQAPVGLRDPPGPRRPQAHTGEAHHMVGACQEKLNRLRTAVLGANDGIVSVATTVVGVAGATASTSAIGVAAAAAVVGGALALAVTFAVGSPGLGKS